MKAMIFFFVPSLLIVSQLISVQCQQDFDRETSLAAAAFINSLPKSPDMSCSCSMDTALCVCNLFGQRIVNDAIFAASALAEFANRTSNSQSRLQEPLPEFLDLRDVHPLLLRIRRTHEPAAHNQIYPRLPTDINATFALFERGSPDPVMIHYNGELAPSVSLVRRFYDRVWIVTHGFGQNLDQDGLLNKYLVIKDLLLNVQIGQDAGIGRSFFNPAVILVDWRVGANIMFNFGLSPFHLFYRGAAINTMVVGREVGLICHLLVDGGFVTMTNIHLIGFSLGGQVMHFAGEHFTRIGQFLALPGLDTDERRLGRITGLDPAGPHFEGYRNADGSKPYLTRVDANFVDIIHTSSVQLNPLTNFGRGADNFLGRFGLLDTAADVDFLPNGGVRQPHCGRIGTCHHGSAILYFIASLRDNSTVRAQLRSVPCENWDFFNECRAQLDTNDNVRSTSVMGIDAEHQCPRAGRQFLEFRPLLDGVLNTPANQAPPQVLEEQFVVTKKMMDIMEAEEVVEKRQLRQIMRQEEGNFPSVDFPQFPRERENIRTVQLDPLDHPACGLFAALPQAPGRAVNAFRTYRRQFPWTVCIMARTLREGVTIEKAIEEKDDDKNYVGWGQHCSGSIIDDSWIITAGHCFDVTKYFGTGTPFYITMGVEDCTAGPPTVVRRVIYNDREGDPERTVWSEFGRNRPEDGCTKVEWDDDDVALIRVRPLTSFLPTGDSLDDQSPINRLCFRSSTQFEEDEYLGVETFVAGYGDKINTAPPNSLRWLPMGGVPRHQKRCGPIYLILQTNKYICLIHYQPRPGPVRAPCSGDSGAPYMWYVNASAQANEQTADTRAILTGVHSAGSLDCTVPMKQSDASAYVLTQLPSKVAVVREFLPFIRGVIDGESGTPFVEGVDTHGWLVPDWAVNHEN